MSYPTRRNSFDQNLDYQLLSLINDCVEETANCVPNTDTETSEEMDEIFTSTFTQKSATETKDEKKEKKIKEETKKESLVTFIIRVGIIAAVIAAGAATILLLTANDGNVPVQSSQLQSVTSDVSSTASSNTSYDRELTETTAAMIAAVQYEVNHE